MEKPLISIITPAYNAARFIGQTLESVKAQTYPRWELLIVVDQNSKDKTLEIVQQESLKDARIKAITSPSALGATRNRNLGLDQARGQYIAFLDADDLWTPDKLEKQVHFMESNGYRFTYTGFTRISLDGSKIGTPLKVPAQLKYQDLLFDNSIGCLTAMVHRDLVKEHRFQEHGWEDMSLWLTLLKDEPRAYGIQDSLAFYRVVPGSRSNNKLFAAKLRWNTYRLVEKFSLAKSGCYFTFYTVNALLKYSRF